MENYILEDNLYLYRAVEIFYVSFHLFLILRHLPGNKTFAD